MGHTQHGVEVLLVEHILCENKHKPPLLLRVVEQPYHTHGLDIPYIPTFVTPQIWYSPQVLVASLPANLTFSLQVGIRPHPLCPLASTQADCEVRLDALSLVLNR